MRVPSPSKRQIIVGTALALGGLILVRYLNSRTRPPSEILWKCGDSPNCASSRDERPAFHLESLPLRGSPQQTLESVRNLASKLPRWSLVAETSTTLNFEVRTAILGFVDDVVFEVETAKQALHFRSASRVGHSDLGQNRRRLEAFRSLWNAQ